MLQIFEAPFGGWKKCLWLINDTVELVITLEVGPRIIRYALKNGKNVMCEHTEDMGKKGEDFWRIYGGHRLWHSPEASPRSYPADNFPVEYSRDENTVTLTPPPEDYARVQKRLTVTLEENSAAVTVEHRITNLSPWTVELAAWALTVLAPGGLEIMPEPERYQALLPDRSLILWPYTSLNDDRIYWGKRYITLRQDAKAETPVKFGLSNAGGWAAYFVNGCLFCKRYTVTPDGVYPDFGASFETYTNDFMLECESLSPLQKLQPDETVLHTEHWSLSAAAMPDARDEAAIAKALGQ